MHPSRRVHPDVKAWIDFVGYRVIDVDEHYQEGDLGFRGYSLCDGARPRSGDDFGDWKKWTPMSTPDYCRSTHRIAIRKLEYPPITQTVAEMLKGLADAEAAYMAAINDKEYARAGRALDVYNFVLQTLCAEIGASEARVQAVTRATASLPTRLAASSSPSSSDRPLPPSPASPALPTP